MVHVRKRLARPGLAGFIPATTRRLTYSLKTYLNDLFCQSELKSCKSHTHNANN